MLSRRANVLDGIYSKHARKIRKSTTCEEVKNAIKELIGALDKKYPSFADFREAFSELKYSKEGDADNVKVKYVINKLHCYYSDSGQEVFSDDGTIEHILPESNGEMALNIGNLILLEMSINNEAGQKEYAKKRLDYYSRSSYKWVKCFVDKYVEWTEKDIGKRAREMAEVYYNNVLRQQHDKK